MRKKIVAVPGIIFSITVAMVLLSTKTSMARAASPPSSNCDPAIETHITGEFNGWEDEKIYKMDNGQIWQQANYHYHYHYAYHPSVIIYKSSTGCKIKVEDDDDEGVTVTRLK
jgi:hypothetical protein